MTFTVWVDSEVFATNRTRHEADTSFLWAQLLGTPSMTITKEK